MKRLKDIDKFSRLFLDKENLKKIKKIKNKEERQHVLQNLLISELKLRHINLELKLKKMKDRKKKHLISLKSNVLHSKILLLRTGFNEKDFKKINSLLDKIKEEIEDA